MDYKTKGTSRERLRAYAKYFRELFDVPQTGVFPVLEILDRLSDVFENTYYEIVDDGELEPSTMAACTPIEGGGFKIEIKESVYRGAYENNDGACRGFILHEVCHVFLFSIGFTPLFEKSFADGEIPAYCSVEWQAKTLCGEVMIPYEERYDKETNRRELSGIEGVCTDAEKDRKEVMHHWKKNQKDVFYIALRLARR